MLGWSLFLCGPIHWSYVSLWVMQSWTAKRIPWVCSAGNLPCFFQCFIVVAWMNSVDGWTCGTWVERTIASMFCTFLAWLQLTPCKARQVQGSENVGQAQKSCFQFSPQFQCLFRRQYECIALLIHGLACFLQVLLRQSVFVQLFFWTPKDKTFYSCLHLDLWGSPALLQLLGIFYVSQFFS